MTVTIPQAYHTTREFLFAAASAVCYGRSLYTESSFGDREYTANGKVLKSKVLQKGDNKEADHMIALIEDEAASRLQLAELGCFKFLVTDTIDHPDFPGRKKYRLEIYSIDVAFPLSDISENERGKVIEQNTALLPEIYEQFLPILSKLVEVIGSLRPLSPERSETIMIAGVEDDVGDYDTDSVFDLHRAFQEKVSENNHDSQGMYEKDLVETGEVQLNMGTLDAVFYSTSVSIKCYLSDFPHIRTDTLGCECYALRDRRPGGDKVAAVKCKLCSRSIHRCCYAIDENAKPNIICFACTFGDTKKIPRDLKSIMRIRYLWRYLLKYDLPESTDAFKSLFPVFIDVTSVLNTMIKYSILEVSGTIANIRKDQKKLRAKTGYMEINLQGMKKPDGEPLVEGQKYYFMFSPHLINRDVAKLKYNKATKSLFFPKIRDISKEELEQRCSKVFGESLDG